MVSGPNDPFGLLLLLLSYSFASLTQIGPQKASQTKFPGSCCLWGCLVFVASTLLPEALEGELEASLSQFLPQREHMCGDRRMVTGHRPREQGNYT